MPMAIYFADMLQMSWVLKYESSWIIKTKDCQTNYCNFNLKTMKLTAYKYHIPRSCDVNCKAAFRIAKIISYLQPWKVKCQFLISMVENEIFYFGFRHTGSFHVEISMG